jgi:predicted GH43/DUF377 family glycosyl hydrolase
MRRLTLYSAILLVLSSCSLRKQDSPGNIMNVRLTIEAISGSEGPVLTNGAVGTEGNKYGFEGGTVIRLQDGYHLFTSEMAGDPRWVKMKLAHWLSADGVQWKRISTVRESSGDFTGKDPCAAIWSPMPFFNVERNLWVIHYIGYRARPDSAGMWLSNYEGRVFRLISKTIGIDGIDGPYEDAGMIMEPGKDSDPFEGLQGTDSFFPYEAAGKYYAFYGSAQTQHLPIKLWQVGLASAGNPEGPWKRCSELNPVDLGISFTENPIVTKLDNGLFVAVVDAGYDSTGLKRSAFGYFYSNDGIHWSKEQLCYIENKVPKWWNQMRTPLCLIKEDDGSYTVFHTAYKKNDYGSIGKLKVKINTDSIKPLIYADNRPVCKQRMDATDIGVVLHYGDGPDSCDISGARDLWVYRANDSLFCMHYDAAGPRGWLASLAISKDLINWEKRGPVLQLGKKNEPDSRSASYGTTYFDGKKWHMFYLGTPNVTAAPDFIPSFPYLNMKAESASPFGPWIKKPGIIPFMPGEGTFYSSTASPGFIVKNNDEYMMFFSAADYTIKRTICIARTKDLDSEWKIDSLPILPAEEQIENSSLYFEETNQTWFLFTNHIGYDKDGEYTDAIWVYWSKDLNRWNPEHKAVVLDGQNCKWSFRCIGLPSVIKYKNRLAVLYDAPGDNSVSHMRRSIGLAFMNLPLVTPQQQ